MHELSVCQALLTQIAEIASEHGARVVERVTIEMGPLCGVEPALLARAFAVARLGGCAAQAVLLIESTPVTIRCSTCGAQSEPKPNRLVCGVCGGFRTHVVAGDELRLRRVELRTAESRPASVV
jgi:hydrogenase nickel incorporation protein HypA/HybF